jgi:hypothetical protein
VGNGLSSEGRAPSFGRSTEYFYDLENRLTEVNYTGLIAQYKYDPFEERGSGLTNFEICKKSFGHGLEPKIFWSAIRRKGHSGGK